MSIAIPKNNIDDHYFVFPGYTWRSLETGVLDKQYLPLLMRPSVRYAARFPVAPPTPELDALIKDNDLMERVTRQETGDDETVAIGRLGKNIGQVEEFSDIPIMIATALGKGLSLDGAGEALSIGAASLFMRSLGGNPMDVHLHTSINLRRYLIRLEGLSLRNKLLLLLNWHLGPEIRSTQTRMQPPPQPDMQAVAALPPRSQDGAARRDPAQHLQPAADRLVAGDQSRADARRAGGQGDRQPRDAVHAERVRPAGVHRASGRNRLPRQFHRDARLQAPQRGRRGIPQHARPLALDAPRVRRPGGGDLVRQEHGRLRAVSRPAARGVIGITSVVMAVPGLDPGTGPAIHEDRDVDARLKAGHDYFRGRMG